MKRERFQWTDFLKKIAVIAIPVALQILVMTMSSLLRSIERVKLPLYGGVAAVATNCLFNYLLIITFVFVDEPVRYVIMQKHLYSAKWIKPVSGPGKAALEEFQKSRGIRRKRAKA